MLEKKLKDICRLILILIAIVNLLVPFNFNIGWIIFILGIIVLICAIPIMGRSFKLPTIIFSLLGAVLFFFQGESFSGLVTGTGSMLTVVSIIVVISLFSIPIQLGGYFKAIEQILIRYLHTEAILFLFIMIVSHFFASILLFGVIPVMMALFGKMLERNVQNYPRFFSSAVSRGYALVLLWAPGSINVLLVMQGTGASWLEVFVPGIILSTIGIFTAYFLESKRTLSHRGISLSLSEGEDASPPMANKEAIKKIAEIILVIVSLAALTVFFEKVTGFASTYRVLLAGILISGIWIFKYRRSPEIGKAFRGYWDDSVAKVIDLAGLFIAIGIFSAAIQDSSFMIVLQQYLPSYMNLLGPWMVAVIPLVVIALSLTGLHPFVTVVLVGQILTSIDLPIDRGSLAMAIAMGGPISYMVSPFAGMTLTLAKFTGRKPSEISIKWNGLFAIIFFIEGLALNFFIQAVFY